MGGGTMGASCVMPGAELGRSYPLGRCSTRRRRRPADAAGGRAAARGAGGGGGAAAGRAANGGRPRKGGGGGAEAGGGEGPARGVRGTATTAGRCVCDCRCGCAGCCCCWPLRVWLLLAGWLLLSASTRTPHLPPAAGGAWPSTLTKSRTFGTSRPRRCSGTSPRQTRPSTSPRASLTLCLLVLAPRCSPLSRADPIPTSAVHHRDPRRASHACRE